MKLKTLFAAMVVGSLLAGCSSLKTSVNDAPTSKDEKVWASEEERPKWTLFHNSSNVGSYEAVGESDFYTTEKAAKQAAIASASAEIARLVNSRGRKDVLIQSQSGSSASKAAETQVNTQMVERITADAVLKRATIKDMYIEAFKDKNENIYWKAYALMVMPVEQQNMATIFKPDEKPSVQEKVDAGGEKPLKKR